MIKQIQKIVKKIQKIVKNTNKITFFSKKTNSTNCRCCKKINFGLSEYPSKLRLGLKRVRVRSIGRVLFEWQCKMKVRFRAYFDKYLRRKNTKHLAESSIRNFSILDGALSRIKVWNIMLKCIFSNPEAFAAEVLFIFCHKKCKTTCHLGEEANNSMFFSEKNL